MFKDLLPIGSVVLLQGGTKKLMIITTQTIVGYKKTTPTTLV